jgi:RNA polymerase sigma factor (sigma-70 family)
MTEPSDTTLLQDWSIEGSEEAFAMLAGRYGGLLYHASMRRTGRADLAGEAAQNALLILARKATRLNGESCLAGWLHRTACYEAAKLLRRETRHEARMKRFHLHHDPEDTGSPWQEVAPLLDQALDALPERDRQVIFAKYFDGLSFEQIARQFGGEPAAWRQRGSRAIERLRGSLAKRGVAVSSAALSSGLGTALGQAAPPAFLASLGSTPAAAAALSWQTLTLHSIYLMKMKPAVVIAATLLISLVPLGLQARAIVDARGRMGILETALARHESAVASSHAKQPGGATARVNLVALADALLAAEQGDYAKRLRAERQVNAMDVEELERLLLEAANLEMGSDQRSALICALFEQFCQLAMKSGMPCEHVVDLATRLGPQMGLRWGDVWIKAHENIRHWIDTEPDAAAAWFQETWKSGVLGDPPIPGSLLGLAFDALHLKDPGSADEFFRSLSDFERHNLIGTGGGRGNPETMIGLAAEIGDAGLRSSALSQVIGDSEGKSAREVRAWIDDIQASPEEAIPLLIAAARRPLGEEGAKTILDRLEWLQEASAGLDSSRAAGEFFAEFARINPATSREALDAEWQRNPDERMVASYLCYSFFSNEAVIVDAVPLGQLITDPALRDDSLRRLLTWTRSNEAARTLARKGGMSEREIDRLIPAKP